MDNEIDQPAAVEAEEQETSEEQLVDTTDWRAEALKARRIAARRQSQLIKLKEVKVEAKPDSKPETAKPEDNGLLQKSFLRAAGITHPEDVALALTTSKKWGVEVDQLVDDDDFKAKLERQQSTRSNAQATSNIQGGAGAQQAKSTPDYWIAKGTPPSASDVPDRKARAKIARAMMENAKNNGKRFYND